MKTEIYSSEEHRLLDAWFNGRSLTLEEEDLLVARGFDHDCQPYTRLDAWVGGFAVAEIQARLPNCGVFHSEGQFVLTRTIRPVPSRKVTGLSRFLFRINWADSAPGLSWPADYNLVWLPEFDRFVLTYSADSTDMFGYCDFALGTMDAEDDWRMVVREILVSDWRFQFAEWNQSPWAYVLDVGVVSEEDALAWRREAWEGHEDFAAEVRGDSEEDNEVRPFR